MTVWILSGLLEYAKKTFSQCFFKSLLSVWRCIWTGQINLKILLGYNISYLSIWPFMHHPWFPTRKDSKLTFICFQLQLLKTMQGLNNWSWKQKNDSFEWSCHITLFRLCHLNCEGIYMSMYPKYALVPKYLSLVLSNFVQIKKTSICWGICMPMYMHAMVPNYLSPVLSNFVQIKI